MCHWSAIPETWLQLKGQGWAPSPRSAYLGAEQWLWSALVQALHLRHKGNDNVLFKVFLFWNCNVSVTGDYFKIFIDISSLIVLSSFQPPLLPSSHSEGHSIFLALKECEANPRAMNSNSLACFCLKAEMEKDGISGPTPPPTHRPHTPMKWIPVLLLPLFSLAVLEKPLHFLS